MKSIFKTRVVVGMSGGVDSSVTALLLKEQGYEVHGVFMKNWEADQEDPYCTVTKDLSDAQQVCEQLKIPFHTVNFAQEYWHKVFQYFLDELAVGRTPNPDIICNKEIKFNAFLKHALEFDADFLATGHYARCARKDDYQLLKGLDSGKDQSYFLYTLGQEQLKYCLFPLGELEKKTVRKIAADAGFINHNKKDSTGICFVGERKFKPFLKEYLLAQPGNIETENGEIVGKHEGLMYYTIGQRKGMGIGGRKENAAAWFVSGKDLQRKVLKVVQGENHPSLFSKQLMCNQLHWINPNTIKFPLHCEAKIRYRQAQQECIVTEITENKLHVEFITPQRAITPGQSIVFYAGELCLGGGVII